MDETLRKLVQTYEAAEYVVNPFGDESVLLVLRVGKHSPDLDLLLQDEEDGAESWAFVTAFNPGSRELSEEANRAAQGRLEARLEEEGLAYWPGWGQSPDGEWREESLFVVGVTRERAVRLGREFGQVAVLYGNVGGGVELVLCETPLDRET